MAKNMSPKSTKELELELHKHLYDNLKLLTVDYPPTAEFREYFKKDMFLKNNKAAFHHVIHFLLNVLDPEKLKEKITTWPIVDIGTENKFRKEVMAYIIEINATYEDVNIPNITTSNLIHPGGFKFIYFMYTVAQLVLRKDLKRDPEIARKILLPIKPNKSGLITSERIKRLNVETAQIWNDTRKLEAEFLNMKTVAQSLAEEIMQKQEKVGRELQEIQSNYTKIKPTFNKNCNQTDFDSCINKLNAKMQILQETCIKFKTLRMLVDDLNSDSAYLQHDKSNFVVPSEIAHIIHPEQPLDLVNLLQGFVTWVNNNRLKIHMFSDGELANKIKTAADSEAELTVLAKSYEEIHCKLLNVSQKLEAIKESKMSNTEPVPACFRQLEFESDVPDSALTQPLEDLELCKTDSAEPVPGN